MKGKRMRDRNKKGWKIIRVTSHIKLVTWGGASERYSSLPNRTVSIFTLLFSTSQFIPFAYSWHSFFFANWRKSQGENVKIRRDENSKLLLLHELRIKSKPWLLRGLSVCCCWCQEYHMMRKRDSIKQIPYPFLPSTHIRLHGKVWRGDGSLGSGAAENRRKWWKVTQLHWLKALTIEGKYAIRDGKEKEFLNRRGRKGRMKKRSCCMKESKFDRSSNRAMITSRTEKRVGLLNVVMELCMKWMNLPCLHHHFHQTWNDRQEEGNNDSSRGKREQNVSWRGNLSESNEGTRMNGGWNSGHFIGYLFPSSFSWLDSFLSPVPSYRLNSLLNLLLASPPPFLTIESLILHFYSFSLDFAVSFILTTSNRRSEIWKWAPFLSVLYSFYFLSFNFNHSRKWKEGRYKHEECLLNHQWKKKNSSNQFLLRPWLQIILSLAISLTRWVRNGTEFVSRNKTKILILTWTKGVRRPQSCEERL